MFQNYKTKTLKKDILSGIIVALVSIPISMGYAQVAGLPVVYGLYGSLLPILVFSLITSSPQFVFGVDATPAALVGAIKAYETMTGEEIDDENLDAANDELVLTGKLVEDIGDSEKAEDLMALVKQEVAENKLTSAEDNHLSHLLQLAVDFVFQIHQLDIQLSEENQKQIAELMKKIEGLDLDVDKLKDQAKDLYQKLENLDFHVDKESVGNFFTRIIDAIVKFFQGLFGK